MKSTTHKDIVDMRLSTFRWLVLINWYSKIVNTSKISTYVMNSRNLIYHCGFFFQKQIVADFSCAFIVKIYVSSTNIWAWQNNAYHAQKLMM